ncbi:MAG: xanthomonadin biosynthesis protein [Rhodanobacteraceae bacterium]|nr:MAG: xanthomonadin biosynthesis protein [Rhodanobacteraceae bacterium]
MTTVPAQSVRTAASTLPWFGLALLACAGLGVAGGLTQRPWLSVAAALLLLLAWLPRVWRQRSRRAGAGWLALAALLLVPAALGHAVLALMALPVVFLALAGWLFARTLRRGREPLVTRFARVLEGEAQLQQPRVRRYTRGVTVFWAWLLGAMAGLSLAIALLAQPGGWLAAFGMAPAVQLPGSLLVWYPEFGCWAVLALAFSGEYAFRRWYLRGVAQMSAGRFAVRLVRRWPALLRGEDGLA